MTWVVEVDNRPLVVDRALLWIHERSPSGRDAWRLANLYRHPLEEKGWHLSTVYDVPYVGERAFASPPDRAKLDRFLHDTWWTFKPSDGFRMLDAQICDKAWTAAIGAAPDHTYP